MAPFLRGKNWYEELKNYVNKYSPNAFMDQINGACDRDRLASKIEFNYEEAKSFPGRIFTPGSAHTDEEIQKNIQDREDFKQAEGQREKF